MIDNQRVIIAGVLELAPPKPGGLKFPRFWTNCTSLRPLSSSTMVAASHDMAEPRIFVMSTEGIACFTAPSVQRPLKLHRSIADAVAGLTDNTMPTSQMCLICLLSFFSTIL
jgi:hypothetical protein